MKKEEKEAPEATKEEPVKVEEKKEEPKAAPKPQAVKAPAPMPAEVKLAGPQITLNRYFTLRGIRPQRRGGMRAFTTMEKATLEDWDKEFSGY